MYKMAFKTGAGVGAITGAATILLVVVGYILRYWTDTPQGGLVFLGNLIIYLPFGLFAGALVGLVGGALGAFVNHRIGKDKIQARFAAFCGGLAGGILVGVTPIWLGFGYL
jgi:hypothetical protein